MIISDIDVSDNKSYETRSIEIEVGSARYRIYEENKELYITDIDGKKMAVLPVHGNAITLRQI